MDLGKIREGNFARISAGNCCIVVAGNQKIIEKFIAEPEKIREE